MNPLYCAKLAILRKALSTGGLSKGVAACRWHASSDRPSRQARPGGGPLKTILSARRERAYIKLTPGRHRRFHARAPPALAQPRYKSGAEIAAFAFWCVYVLSFTILLSAEAILSTSCSVLFFPREMRIVPAACSSSSPMAWSTWDILKQRERGALIVVSCHDRDFLDDVSDVIYHIQEGRIIDEA